MARRVPARPKRVALGVSGSIAAYKACLIVRGLVRAGAEVRVAMTPSAAKFVSPLTLATLSRAPVYEDVHAAEHWEMAHLSLASWADRVLIAPATADTIARLAQGRAGGPLEALVLSTTAPVAVAPAMDTEMWEHPATKANVVRLRDYGYKIWGPVSGDLASGRVGMGRMLEPDDLVRRILA
ncbi:MAG TPA: flavoprotein [Elusimicrobiota bacterium]|nr:flavoprotein [Elusimicrobiota bacterium]